MKKTITKPDVLWKDLATEFDAEFILFFFGKKMYDSIDFSVSPEYLEQEFNEVFAANEPNKKIVDKVIKYCLKNGQYRFIIVHIEFQGKSEKAFAERMFQYFVYIYIKYKTKNVTALALYTGASRPKVYDSFTFTFFGTKLSYQFNTYTVREQDEAELLKSDNPFAIAVLASLYLIKAGKDPNLKLAYKKKLLEIAAEKKFDRQKLFRLLNFVRYLVALPPKLEMKFKQFAHQPKVHEKMKVDLEFLETYSVVLGIDQELIKMKQEAAEKGLEEGIEKGIEKFIMNIRDKMGFTAQQIANMSDYTAEYIQSVIDKYEKKK